MRIDDFRKDNKKYDSGRQNIAIDSAFKFLLKFVSMTRTVSIIKKNNKIT